MQSLHDHVPVVGMQQIGEKRNRVFQVPNVESDNFAPPAVVGHDAARRVPVPYAFAGGVQHIAQAPLAFFQPALRAFEFGNVVGDHQYLLLPFPCDQRFFDRLVVGHFAGGCVGGLFHHHLRLCLRHHLANVLQKECHLLRIGVECPVVFANQFIRCCSIQIGQRTVANEEFAVPVFHQDDVGVFINHRAQQGIRINGRCLCVIGAAFHVLVPPRGFSRFSLLMQVGSHRVTVVPSPRVLSMSIFPRCSVMISCTMLMPRPVPGTLPELSAR